MLAPGRCLFTTGINTHSNQRKSEAQISNSCKSLVAAMGKHSSAPNFEITNMSISEHEGYRRALCKHQRKQTIASLVSRDGFFLLPKAVLCYRWINHALLALFGRQNFTDQELLELEKGVSTCANFVVIISCGLLATLVAGVFDSVLTQMRAWDLWNLMLLLQ